MVLTPTLAHLPVCFFLPLLFIDNKVLLVDGHPLMQLTLQLLTEGLTCGGSGAGARGAGHCGFCPASCGLQLVSPCVQAFPPSVDVVPCLPASSIFPPVMPSDLVLLFVI